MPKLNIDKLNEFIKTIPETPFEEVSNTDQENKGTLPVVYDGGKDSSLDNKTEKEASIEEVAEILKNNKIDQIIVAGENINKDRNSPEKIPGLHPDLDSKLALYLLNNYNKKSLGETYNEGAVSSVVNKDWSGKEAIQKNVGIKVYIDTGGNWLKIEKEGETTTLHVDHHGVGQRSPTSGVKMTAEIMEKAGILKEKPEWLNKLIDFVNDVDNLTYLDKKDKKGNKIFTESYFRNEWSGSFYALAEKKIPFNLLVELCEKGIIKDLTKPLTDEEINGEIGKIKVDERTVRNIYLAEGEIPLNLLMELYEKGVIKDPTKPLTDEEINGEIGKIKIGRKTIKDICIEQRKEVSNTLDVGVKNSIQNNKKEGLDLENTRLGKIIYHNHFKIRGVANKILDHLAFKATIAKGYDTFVAYDDRKKKRSFFINSKNPNLSIIVEELNKKYPDCAIDIRGVMVYGKIVDGMTEEDFLNIIDPKILEGSNKVFKKEKLSADKGVDTPVDTESTAAKPEEKDAEYEAKKADIEKRKEEAKELHDNSVLTAGDNGFVVKKSKYFYETAKDLRAFIQKQSTADQTGIIYKFKDNDNIYNYAISTYDEKRGAGIGYVGYSVKVDKDTSLTDEEIYEILENNLDAAFDQKFPNKETWKTDKDTGINSIEKNLFDKIKTKYDAELAELDKKFGKEVDQTVIPTVESTEKIKSENLNIALDKYKESISETNKLKEKLATLIELRRKMEEEEQATLAQSLTEDEEKENAGENINSNEEKETFIHEIKMGDFEWSFPDYVNRTGKLTIDGSNIDYLEVVEKKDTMVKRNFLGSVINGRYKKIQLENPHWEISIHRKDGKEEKIDNIAIEESEMIKKVNDICFQEIKELALEIKKDEEEKPFLYYIFEKNKNTKTTTWYKNKLLNNSDLRKINLDEIYRKSNLLQRTGEDEGFFDFNILGFTKIIKNVKELTSKEGISANSNKAIYKIVGPNNEIVADNIQGYGEASKIYWEKTNEYQKVAEEEFNKLNSKK